MASRNPFDVLGDFDNEDPSVAIETLKEKKPPLKAPAKLPTKPLPPSQAVREARSSVGSTRSAFRGRGRGRGYGNENTNGFAGDYGGGGGDQAEDGNGGRPMGRERGTYSGQRGGYRGGRRGGFAGGDERRIYERRSGTGRGTEIKRDGSGKGNWGTSDDDLVAQEVDDAQNGKENVGVSEKESEQGVGTESKEDAMKEKDEEREEEKELTLEEYEKIMEEKRKALLEMKAEERKVELDKEFESMKLLSVKKGNDDIFIKLGSDKASRKQRDGGDKDERVKKHVSINEFLKPADGEKYYRPGGRGRGRGRGRGDGGNGPIGYDAALAITTEASVKIEDTKQFPSLGGK